MNLLLLLMLLGQESPFPDGDPAPAIEAAKKKATTENRRVLVLAGTNDSESDRAVATMLKKNREVARLILYEYDLVLVGYKPLTKAIGAPPVPWVHILTADGKELFKAAAPNDPKVMVELLNKHKAPPLVAQDVLDAAKKKAGEEKKRVLLTFGAPW